MSALVLFADSSQTLPEVREVPNSEVARLSDSLGERSEKRLRFRNLGEFRRRHETFERRCERVVRRRQDCSRQRGTQLSSRSLLKLTAIGHLSAQKASAAQRKLSERMDTAGALPSHGSESEES
jgi:hypothetical protein